MKSRKDATTYMLFILHSHLKTVTLLIYSDGVFQLEQK